MSTKNSSEHEGIPSLNQILESEERYKNFIQLSSEGIWRFEFVNQEGFDIEKIGEKDIEEFFDKAVLAECNLAMANMYGLENCEDLVGLRLRDLMVETKEENLAMLRAFVANRFQLKDAESVEKDNQGNIKYFLNNLVGIIKNGKLYGAWGTQRDISDRKKSEDALMLMNFELTKKNDQLVKINGELDNFIYSVSHDLNAPLSNIEGLINVLKINECYQQDDAKQIIDLMDVAIGRFKKTLRDLTEIAKLQVNTVSEPQDEVVLEEVLDEVLFSIKNMVSDTHAEIKSEFTIPKLKIKKISLQSILYNLISNAIKYRHPDRKPEISLRTRTEGSYIILQVSDNGIGMPADKLQEIFTMFKRLHTHVEGSGVGLYLVKRIVEAAGGKVEAQSELDKGSSFTVYFRTV